MTTGLPVSQGAARRRVDAVTVLRLLLVSCWAVVAAATLALGERSSSFDDLQEQVAEGHVDRVQVSGVLPPGSHGFVTQQVRWQRGPVQFVAEVLQRSPGGHIHVVSSPDRPVLREDVGTRLRGQYPGLEVARSVRRDEPGEVAGWSVPGWVAVAGLVLFLLTFGLLTSGPEPRWVTRWGWFWFLALAPWFGVLAYLLLGRARGAVPARRDRRMTGLPAFLWAAFALPMAWVVLTLPL